MAAAGGKQHLPARTSGDAQEGSRTGGTDAKPAHAWLIPKVFVGHMFIYQTFIKPHAPILSHTHLVTQRGVVRLRLLRVHKRAAGHT